jgi:hypothetical protein
MLSFQYTKENKVTDRVFIPLETPTDKYFGIDITELSEEEQGVFAAMFSKIIEDKEEAVHSLMSEFDLKFKFRYFIPSKMSNISKE